MKFGIAVHGGAGTILKSSMTPEKEKEYRNGLEKALRAGNEILKVGGSALDAVTAAVVELENFPLFNAGKGAVFNSNGEHELDASIMDGKTKKAGAVSSVKHILHPIVLAKLVMEKSEHVMLTGEGAEIFASNNAVPLVPNNTFDTEHRYRDWQTAQATNTIQLDHHDDKHNIDKSNINFEGDNKSEEEVKERNKKMGTVGAVAIDMEGNLASATSTGGMTNKKYGRVGDTPIIGAGTYADNNYCAVSCTGHGEFFIRYVVAFDIRCLMEYKNYSLQQACDEVVKGKLAEAGGEGGVIAVDKFGNFHFSINCEGMYRGSLIDDSSLFTAIYED